MTPGRRRPARPVRDQPGGDGGGARPGGGAGAELAGQDAPGARRVGSRRPAVLRSPQSLLLVARPAGHSTLHEADRRYARQGYLVELQLRYHPRPEQEGNVDAWVRFVERVVRKFGRVDAVRAIQVTNEVNFFPIAPDASDSSYAGAREALVRGVIAAKREAERAGHDQLRIGFNWAYRTDPAREQAFWTEIGSLGGADFVARAGLGRARRLPGHDLSAGRGAWRLSRRNGQRDERSARVLHAARGNSVQRPDPHRGERLSDAGARSQLRTAGGGDGRDGRGGRRVSRQLQRHRLPLVRSARPPTRRPPTSSTSTDCCATTTRRSPRSRSTASSSPSSHAVDRVAP